MRILFAILLLSATTFGFAADAPSKYALLVGVSKYRHTDMNKPQLEFPEIDAKELADIFKSSGYTVDLLLGKQATKETVKAKLKDLENKGDSDGVVVIGLFGHGVEFEATKLACYCPYDTTIRNVVDSNGRQLSSDDGMPMVEPNPDSLITMAEILAGLRISPAGNRILLADCCRTSPNAARSATILAKGRAFGADMKVSDLPGNTAAFFACSANEQAFEHPDWGHGAFTKCLIDEIKSQSTSGRVTAGKLADELQPKVKRLVASATGGKKQTLNPITNGVVDFQLSIPIASTTKTKPTPPPTQPSKPPETASRGFEGTKAGDKKELNGIPFIWCPPGTFTMGTPGATDDESPVSVTLSSGFWLGETEMTEGQYKKLMSNGSTKGNDYPVTEVSYDDAVSYCQKLTTQERSANRLPKGWKYSLPTEAQWEYACRAGTKTKYWFGDNESQLSEYAWYDKNSSGGVNRVGQKKPNAWGLLDMHGNVFEWCNDWYGEKLPGGRDPQCASSGSYRVLRGGGWSSFAVYCRSADRDNGSPGYRLNGIGFRLAAVPE